MRSRSVEAKTRDLVKVSNCRCKDRRKAEVQVGEGAFEKAAAVVEPRNGVDKTTSCMDATEHAPSTS